MPDIGDSVCFYTHEQMDASHRTIDRVGIVLAVTEGYVDLKVLELGRPPYDERAYYYEEPEYDANGNLIVGKSYWRELGEEPPDFDAPLFRDPKTQEPVEAMTPEAEHDLELDKLQQRQAKEAEGWTGTKEALQAKHDREIEEFEQGWDASFKAPGQPVRTSGLALKPVAPPPTIDKSLPKIL